MLENLHTQNISFSIQRLSAALESQMMPLISPEALASTVKGGQVL